MSTTLEAKPATEQTSQNPHKHVEPKPVEVEVNFGNGRYSPEMVRIYTDLQERFGIPAGKAEKIARQAGSDAGAALKNTTAKIKVSKSNSEGKVSIKDIAAAVKGVTETFPLKLVHSLDWIGEAGKHGVSFGFTGWKLDQASQKWVDALEV